MSQCGLQLGRPDQQFCHSSCCSSDPSHRYVAAACMQKKAVTPIQLLCSVATPSRNSITRLQAEIARSQLEREIFRTIEEWPANHRFRLFMPHNKFTECLELDLPRAASLTSP